MNGTRRLPKPDEFGNLWFGERTDDTEPVIFPSKRLKTSRRGENEVVRNGTWIVMLGPQGFLFDGPQLQRFPSPRAALEEINRREL